MNFLATVSPETRVVTLEETFELEGGGGLEKVEVAFRTWGSLNAAGDNAVLVCHALTGSADVDDWWEGLLGPGRALDPALDFVVATNLLGGCYGTLGPSSSAPTGIGSFGPDFPSITIRDQVRVQASVLKALGACGLRLVVGGSMGGMQALEWAVMEPLPVEAIAAIGSPASHSPWAVGLADAQRRAIRTDPAWRGGRYSPTNPPRQGLAVARMIAMCTYRSHGSFQQRFQREKHPAGPFQVESYLRYQGEKLGNRFDPNAYLTLTEAMDTHDLARGRGPLPDVLSGLRAEVLVVGVRSDVLYPPDEVEELAHGIPGAELTWIDSPHGHDAFLMEQDQLSGTIRSFRQRVDGVHDRDPRQSPDAVLLPRLGYAEARAMAKNGAKVLHPRALDPIEPLGTPLRVRNTLRPKATGTWVVDNPGGRAVQRESQPVHLILAGATGGVGRTFLKQLQELGPTLRLEGVEVRVSGAFSSRAQLWHREGIPPEAVPKALVYGAPPDWNEVTRRLINHAPSNPVFVDCTASPEVSHQYVQVLMAGVPVITPNKLAGSGTLAQYRSIRDTAQRVGSPYRYETTVGAGLPILRTVRELRQGGDRFRRITGVLSGTLSFVFARLAAGEPFSQAVREARDRGFTEPHPREDLSGTDVARKLLILLREGGFEVEPDSIPVESLVPGELAQVEDPEAFLDGLRSFDGLWATRGREAEGNPLSFVAWFDGKQAGVGVKVLPAEHALSALRPTENMVVLETDRYPDVPLTIAGPGAGREVTASGVMADFLSVVQERYPTRRVA